MRSTRKAQMEIMGLIVIVILLTLGMFFIISFKASNPIPEIKADFEDKQLATNFGLTYLQTSTGCARYNMQDMILDCAIDEKLICDGEDSCDYIVTKTDTILDNTLDVWKKDYRMKITTNIDSVPIIYGPVSENCELDRERLSFAQPIELYPYAGTVLLQLSICN